MTNILRAASTRLRPVKYPFYRVTRESASRPGYRVFEFLDRDLAQERFDMEMASTAFGQVTRFEHFKSPSHCSLIISVGEDG
jgi:hypothetical protein